LADGTDDLLVIFRTSLVGAISMGGAVGTAGTAAAAVPLLREVRQDKVLPYHILVKKILKHIGDLVLLI